MAKGHKSTRSSGSPRHTEMVGPGPVAGAGETMPVSSGKSRETRAGMAPDMYSSEATPKGPGKVPNHTRGRDEG